MNGSLQAMGVQAAFDESMVDLSNMLDRDVQLMLEQIFHNRGERHNEAGTEAAGSFARIFHHPFAFFVAEETSRAVVFRGACPRRRDSKTASD
jgi:serine protease inhibitor